MVAIKDMEMPSCCAKCVLLNMSIMGIKSCKALGHEIGQYESKQKRADDCPLIKIEQSEDCVSREEVVKEIQEWRDTEFVKMTNPYHYLEKRLSNLPPVTPTHCIAAVRFSKEDLREICNERIEIEYTECTHGTCKKCNWSARSYMNGKDEHYCNKHKKFTSNNFSCNDWKKGESNNG